MFTPRQVSMGNKVYKLHIKHDAKKASINIPPDHSILQLKEAICSEFKVAPEQQNLICNGKPMEVSDLQTLKQAKIPNGSRIICFRQNPIVQQPEKVDLDETMSKLTSIEVKANDLEQNLKLVDKERKKLESEDAPLFHGDKTADYKKLKLECGKNGEQLMRLLESLDMIILEEGQTVHRTKRKEVATKLNTILDKNDKMLDKLKIYTN